MIDWERVETLRDEVGGDNFGEVAALFLEEVDEVVARLATAQGAESLERDLHFMKGCALNLGFSALGALCENGERLAAEGRAAEVDVAVVVALYRASRQEFITAIRLSVAA